jgi:hypothetical protein
VITIATVVEGETEEYALPVLLRRMSFGADAEQVRDAAGAVRALMVGGRYKKTFHAARLSAALSLDEARKCRWYRKLESELGRVRRA